MVLPDGTPGNFADILAQLQNVHVFVSVLGACSEPLHCGLAAGSAAASGGKRDSHACPAPCVCRRRLTRTAARTRTSSS